MKKILILLLITITLYAKQETIVFAAGCFWGVEKHFDNMDGVIEAKAGYAGGNYKNPTYKQVLKYRNLKNNSNIVNHTEVVQVKFDNEKVSVTKFIKSFWEIHDSTQLNQQGNDIGNNYRSALYYTNNTQKDIALETKEVYQKLLTKNGFGKIVTEIDELAKFYEAEDYHQDYLKVNPNGYCPNHATGVKFEKTISKTNDKTILPLKGKEIIVIELDGFCPYCEKFKKDVSSSYQGSIPLRTVFARNLKNFDIKTKLDATPTILFIEDGKEKISHIGYMNKNTFYKTLGAFKLGKNSESYNVAFNEGTDGRFCKEYDIFKNTPDGIFVDKLSGEKLFDTKDRFNSKTGWLSFYKAIDGSTIEKIDLRYGMKRVEVRSKKSDIHLGHVFDEFGKRRFCINATVLEFVSRDKIK